MEEDEERGILGGSLLVEGSDTRDGYPLIRILVEEDVLGHQDEHTEPAPLLNVDEGGSVGILAGIIARLRRLFNKLWA